MKNEISNQEDLTKQDNLQRDQTDKNTGISDTQRIKSKRNPEIIPAYSSNKQLNLLFCDHLSNYLTILSNQ